MSIQISAGIQTAFPRVSTEWLIFGNAKEWLQTGTDILIDHYDVALREASQAVSQASRVRWTEAWEIAIKWTRCNVKCLREVTLQWASRAVARLMRDDGGEGTSQAPKKQVCKILGQATFFSNQKKRGSQSSGGRRGAEEREND